MGSRVGVCCIAMLCYFFSRICARWELEVCPPMLIRRLNQLKCRVVNTPYANLHIRNSNIWNAIESVNSRVMVEVSRTQSHEPCNVSSTTRVTEYQWQSFACHRIRRYRNGTVKVKPRYATSFIIHPYINLPRTLLGRNSIR